jgi:hypothetical protein
LINVKTANQRAPKVGRYNLELIVVTTEGEQMLYK